MGGQRDVRATVAVLYTRQRPAKRPVYREGTLRVAAGSARLLDSEGVEIDAETCTAGFLARLRAGEELVLSAHVVRPEAPAALLAPEGPRRPAEALPTAAPPQRVGPASTPPAQASGRAQRAAEPEQPSALKAKQPFKKPRLALRCDPLADEAPPSLPGGRPLLELRAGTTGGHPSGSGQPPQQRLAETEGSGADAADNGGQPAEALAPAEPRGDQCAAEAREGAMLVEQAGDLWRECAAEDSHWVLRGGDEAWARGGRRAIADLWTSCAAEDLQRRGGGALAPSAVLGLSAPGARGCATGATLLAPCVAPLAGQQAPTAAGQLATSSSGLPEDAAILPAPIRSPARCPSGRWGATAFAAAASPTEPPPSAGGVCFAAAPTAAAPPPEEHRPEESSDDELLLSLPAPPPRPAALAAACTRGPGRGERQGEAPPQGPPAAEPASEDDMPLAAAAGPAAEDDMPLAAAAGLAARRLASGPGARAARIGRLAAPKRAAARPRRAGEAQARKAAPSAGRQAPPQPPQPPQPLQLSFSQEAAGVGADAGSAPPSALAERGEYARCFASALVQEMQVRLSDIAASWFSWAGGPDLHADVRAVVHNLLAGPSVGPDGTATLIVGRRTTVSRGDVRTCSRGDVWILLPRGLPPLLFRSLWRGVNPNGKLLCAAINEPAFSWLATRRSHGPKLVAMPSLVCGGFSAELSQLDALQAFAAQPAGVDCRASVDEHELSLILGTGGPAAQSTARGGGPAPQPPEPARAPELSWLSAEQGAVVQAVAQWVDNEDAAPSAVLVRGVFGSGKSRTLAACITMLDRALTARKDPRRILLLCQTNVAVDTVLHLLLSEHEWDDFARLGSFRGVQPALLHRTVSLLSTRQAAMKELSEALEKRPPGAREQLQAAVASGVLPPRAVVWRRRRLVAATAAALDAADHFGGDALRCPLVLVDEAAQLTEPTVFGCLRRVGARRLLMVGDPRQLPPRAACASLRVTMLERLWGQSRAAARVELATQHRCHPLIAELSSGLFYGSALRHGVPAEQRASVLGPGAPPVAVVLSDGAEARRSQSYEHGEEAALCAAWAQRALRLGSVRPEAVGIVCLYRPQAAACARECAQRGLHGVEAATADAFQGAEREVIVLSCGRSSAAAPRDRHACCPRRLNVALSRARRHLVIFGSAAFLEGHPFLSKVLEVARQRGSVHHGRTILAG
ncbi:unnamed protein product [Prorocentrum cordatum]|uniref:DNA helicase n=1 Tax=Prorocentrum cordatum TaxID=2364126 RepID=A0ABN9SDG6_9DINO|nr:unnamed protein product [Polarella glacialis]